MRRKKGKWHKELLACALTALLLCGCGSGEKTKTIVLPPPENREEETENLKINRIREYVGREEGRMYLNWGEPGTDRFCLVKEVGDRYLFQEMDSRTDGVLREFWLEEPAEAIRNLSISPGGKYVAYEVEEKGGMKLIILSTQYEIGRVFREWEDPEETFSYIWTDDGTKLVFWQSGDTKDPYAEWTVGWQEPLLVADGGGVRLDTGRSEFAMEGHGPSWRIVLPNADGSEIYVREQFRSFTDGSEDGEEAGEETRAPGDAYNWLLRPNVSTREELPEYSKESVYPVKYTPAGLFVQDASGSLFLVEELYLNPVKKELVTVDPARFSPTFSICGNGDHVFWTEWLNYSLYQLSGLLIQEGRAYRDPVVLYQDNYESLEEIRVLNDRMIVFWGTEPLENGEYQYKVTALEY